MERLKKIWRKIRGYKDLPERSISEIKNACEILFIDDKSFKVVNILKDAGWKRTERIEDCNLEDARLQDAHIVFVDIDGVGRILGFKDQGLGLATAIKEHYPEKIVIVYSIYKRKDWSFHDSFKTVDDYLSKSVDSYKFLRMVERYSKEVFTVEGCIGRIQMYVKKQTGVALEKDEVLRCIESANNNGVNYDLINAAFRISGSAAGKIIWLYLLGK